MNWKREIVEENDNRLTTDLYFQRPISLATIVADVDVNKKENIIK